MAAQTATPSAPSAQVVGNAFVEQYYHILHHSPELVHRFYQDTSALSRPESDGVMTTVTTMKDINDKICSLDYKNYKAEIKTADAQDSYKDGVIVLVTGCLTGKDNLRKKFTQTFFLAPQDKGYYVLNDVFRYVGDSESDTSAGEIIGIYNTPPSNSLTPDPEPAQVLDLPNLNQATSQTEDVEIVEEKADDLVNDEMQVSNDVDIPVVGESHLEENHISAVAESAISSSQEDAPKKSYASILSSQSKKGTTKVYVPANTLRVAPTITEKKSINSAMPASGPEPSSPTAPVNEPESHDTEDEVEGYSIYIRNLPLSITVAQLESEFKKFGPIKQNGVQVRSKQQGFCFGFVEFQEFSSMQSAIQASPITIEDHQAAVEIKRTTTRVGNGRGRFTSARGGFRNDRFNARGNFNPSQSYVRSDRNFNPGQSYVRSDSFRARGNFSNGRGGEGYQGRGRGGHRGGPSQNATST